MYHALKTTFLTITLALLCVSLYAQTPKLTIEDGRFHEDGMWRFLKIAILLADFSNEAQCDQIISRIPIYKAKNYNAIKLDCYWYLCDTKGDGSIGVSLEPFARLIHAIKDAGMYPIISAETYAVGGGGLPKAFWEANPDADAIDDQGNKVNDDEYGFNSRVVSIFSPAYRTASNNFVKNLTAALPHEKILYFDFLKAT